MFSIIGMNLFMGDLWSCSEDVVGQNEQVMLFDPVLSCDAVLQPCLLLC